jgi:hypothetical protein
LLHLGKKRGSYDSVWKSRIRLVLAPHHRHQRPKSADFGVWSPHLNCGTRTLVSLNRVAPQRLAPKCRIGACQGPGSEVPNQSFVSSCDPDQSPSSLPARPENHYESASGNPMWVEHHVGAGAGDGDRIRHRRTPSVRGEFSTSRLHNEGTFSMKAEES